MLTAAWRRRLEGDSAELEARADGSIIVSTSVESWVESGRSRTRELRRKARYALKSDGTLTGLGTAGSDAEARADRIGQVNVEPWRYALFGHHLHRYTADGVLSASTPIERTLFDSYVREHPDLQVAKWATQGDQVRPIVEVLTFPSRFDLHHDAARSRLIASNWSLYAWVMALDFSGHVEWLSLPSESCCNYACVTGDAIVHVSGCALRLSFLTESGVVARVHDFASDDYPTYPTPDGRGGACVAFRDRVRRYDGLGELTWTVEAPELRAMLVHGGALYVVRREDASLELLAFRLD